MKLNKLCVSVGLVLIVLGVPAVAYAWLAPAVTAVGGVVCVNGTQTVDWSVENLENDHGGSDAYVKSVTVSVGSPPDWQGKFIANNGGVLTGKSTVPGGYVGPVVLNVTVAWYPDNNPSKPPSDQRSASATANVPGGCQVTTTVPPTTAPPTTVVVTTTTPPTTVTTTSTVPVTSTSTSTSTTAPVTTTSTAPPTTVAPTTTTPPTTAVTSTSTSTSSTVVTTTSTTPDTSVVVTTIPETTPSTDGTLPPPPFVVHPTPPPPSGGPLLPVTGSSTGPYALGGAVAIVLGLLLLLVSRDLQTT